MKSSLKIGLGFGITSGALTTLGLMVGLYSGTNSALVVIGGILTIAIADTFSDALGIHVSQEFEDSNSTKEIWEATGYTFVSKLGMALSFIVPLLAFELKTAMIVGVCWGLAVLTWFSYYIAKSRGACPWHVVAEHVGIAVLVIILTNYIPTLIISLLGY